MNPTPARRFEQQLAAYLHARPCDWCGRALGGPSRKMIDKRQYHLT